MTGNDARKSRGRYYTPESIADFLSEWSIRSPNTRVLEPSCGDGIVLESVVKRLVKIGASKKRICDFVLGVEIDRKEAAKAINRLSILGIDSTRKMVHAGDFFEYFGSNLFGRRHFDVVIGNPPFLRYQGFPREIRNRALSIMRRAQLNPSGHTNSWVPFLVCSSLLLSDKGRLAMIVPAELFQVNYAAETRQFLSKQYARLAVLTFEKLMFDEALQEVVMLLGEKNHSGERGIRVAEFQDVKDLEAKTPSVARVLSHLFSSTNLKPLDHSTDKWTQYFLEKDEILLLRELRSHRDVVKCGDLLKVDIGVVTGKNDYFVLDSSDAKARNLKRHVKRIVSNSSALKGILFGVDDWQELIKSGYPAYLFKPPDLPFKKFPHPVRDYINYGRKNHVNNGYKCRIRERWYEVPCRWIPDGFMLRQVQAFPKIVLNETNATSTDTIHRVKFINKQDGRKVAAAFLNSLTLAFTEVTARSYGGGILTIEPSEAEQLPIPVCGADNLDFVLVDRLIREGKAEEVLDLNDRILLRDGLKLREERIRMLRTIWTKLKQRRMNRRRRQN